MKPAFPEKKLAVMLPTYLLDRVRGLNPPGMVRQDMRRKVIAALTLWLAEQKDRGAPKI